MTLEHESPDDGTAIDDVLDEWDEYSTDDDAEFEDFLDWLNDRV